MRTVEEIWTALKEVMDPEIPTISLVDLGVITSVQLNEQNAVHVKMIPTFAGCPAMDYMKREVEEKLKEMDFDDIHVEMNLDEAWNSNRVTDEGRKRLKEFGLGAPPKYEGTLQLEVLNNLPCPQCGGYNTEMQSPFGPTLCRSIHYCRDCREAFQQFKPL